MGGRYTPPLLLQIVLPCNRKEYALKRTAPSIATDRCRSLVRILARLHLSSALRQQQRKRSTAKQVCRSASLIHLNKRPTTKNALRTARLPSPAPARSAVNRMSSVTTGHQAAQCSNYLHSKIERRLPPSLHPKALFFFSTVHGALLFLRTRRKRRGGCILFHEKEKVPSPGRGHPRFPEREKLTPRRGASPIPRQRKHPLS